MEFKNIRLESPSVGLWILTMNRPQSLNALNGETLDELQRAQSELMDRPLLDVRCLIVTGAGEKAFVAGADIKEMVGLSENAAQKFSEKGQKIMRQFEMMKFPVVAAVNGFCLGGGLELALSADFIVASENAKFGLPEVGLGLIPGFGGCLRLARVTGLNRARQMILTGDLVSATEARDMGLVQKLCSQEELIPLTLKFAQTILSRGPVALSCAKRVVTDGFDLSIEGGLALEAAQFGRLFHSSDTQEGLSAFIEKRKSNFQGK